ncbi:MAG: hypothetical protein LBU96_11675 [Yokenella regensburgei]|jgi:hypothetical protein|nr:hypothetical protein [Yokenella regensburgei]
MNKKLLDFINEHHSFLLEKSNGLISARNIIYVKMKAAGCIASFDSTKKTKCCGKCKLHTSTVLVNTRDECYQIIDLLRAGRVLEANQFAGWRCNDEDKNNLVLSSMNNPAALQSAINLVAYDYLKNNHYAIYESEIEKIVISEKQKEVSAKRKKHPHHDSCVLIALATRERYPNSSRTKIGQKLMMYFKESFSIQTVDGWLKDAGIEAIKGGRKSNTFQLVIPEELASG